MDPLARLTALEAPCPVCGAVAFRARLDKHDRLYLSCGICRSRLFAPLTIDTASRILAGAVVTGSAQGRASVEVVRGAWGFGQASADLARPAVAVAASAERLAGTEG